MLIEDVQASMLRAFTAAGGDALAWPASEMLLDELDELIAQSSSVPGGVGAGAS